MPLIDVPLDETTTPVPRSVKEFLQEADLRVSEHLQRSPSGDHGFVPSDPVAVYQALRQIATSNLATGNLFCEWGSGFGLATLLAALLDFDANGVEIDRELIDAANQLAEDFEIPACFVHGSFIPPGAEEIGEESYANDAGEAYWLATEVDDAYDVLGLDVDDFDLIFAYPWPNEESVVAKIFERHAADGALLLTYGNLESMQLRRKVRD